MAAAFERETWASDGPTLMSKVDSGRPEASGRAKSLIRSGSDAKRLEKEFRGLEVARALRNPLFTSSIAAWTRAAHDGFLGAKDTET